MNPTPRTGTDRPPHHKIAAVIQDLPEVLDRKDKRVRQAIELAFVIEVRPDILCREMGGLMETSIRLGCSRQAVSSWAHLRREGSGPDGSYQVPRPALMFLRTNYPDDYRRAVRESRKAGFPLTLIGACTSTQRLRAKKASDDKKLAHGTTVPQARAA